MQPVEVSAPGRANLVGNPSDIYGGSQISCSIARRARVRIAPDPRGALVAGGESLPLDAPDALASRDDLFEVGRACLRHLGAPPAACRIEYASDIPLKSGLAGSTALVVALLHGLLTAFGRPLHRHALAETARRVERDELGIAGGYGDPYMCVFGGLRYLDFRDKLPESDGGGDDEPYATVESLDGGTGPQLPFVLAATGVTHHSGAVHAPIRERWLRGEPEVVRAYARVGAIGRLAKRAWLGGDWSRLGALMNENHVIQRDLGGSGPSNERLIAAALAAGAPGAKLAGAGHGGTIVALWPRADRAPLEAALRAAGASDVFAPSAEPGVGAEPTGGSARSRSTPGPGRTSPRRSA